MGMPVPVPVAAVESRNLLLVALRGLPCGFLLKEGVLMRLLLWDRPLQGRVVHKVRDRARMLGLG